MEFTSTSATSFFFVRETKNKHIWDGEGEGGQMGGREMGERERHREKKDQQTVGEGIYRSSSIRIDYVQYKPFIQIKL